MLKQKPPLADGLPGPFRRRGLRPRRQSRGILPGRAPFRGQPARGQLAYALLFDMVGDKELKLPMEQNSVKQSPDLVRPIWARAKSLGLAAFEARPGPSVLDDHMPLQAKGIPAVDIIDFEYPPWHTLGDTPDKCSAHSLGVVGRLAASLASGDFPKRAAPPSARPPAVALRGRPAFHPAVCRPPPDATRLARPSCPLPAACGPRTAPACAPASRPAPSGHLIRRLLPPAVCDSCCGSARIAWTRERSRPPA